MTMKKSLTLFMILGLGLSSCEKENLDIPNHDERSSKANKNMSGLFANSVITPFFDWENINDIRLPDGTKRILPWYSSSTTAIPSYILEDYKRTDGWELIYNLCGTPGELGQNYFILYNKFTGILRTFYFLNENVTSGSNGMWGITINGNNSLLNNVGYFSESMDKPTSSPFFVTSNITNESISKTINRGWNAFDTEFTYDENANQPLTFTINTFNKNIQDVELSGDLDLESNGTIVSSSSKNTWSDYTKSAAKAAGGEAGQYIKDRIGKEDTAEESDKFKPIKLAAAAAATVISGGVSDIIGAGINLLFGSFIGKKTTSTPTTKKLEFKTQGTLTLNGTITGTEATNVSPVANLLVPGTDQTLVNNSLYPHYNKRMGVWNLGGQPEVKVRRRAYLLDREPVLGFYLYTRGVYLDPTSIDVIINPDVLSEISDYEVSTDLLYYARFDDKTGWDKDSPSGTSLNSFLIEKGILNPKPIYDDGSTIIYKHYNTQYKPGPEPAPEDPTQDNETPVMLTNDLANGYVVKVTVTLYPKSGYTQDPIVITRSYIPTYSFDESY